MIAVWKSLLSLFWIIILLLTSVATYCVRTESLLYMFRLCWYWYWDFNTQYVVYCLNSVVMWHMHVHCMCMYNDCTLCKLLTQLRTPLQMLKWAALVWNIAFFGGGIHTIIIIVMWLSHDHRACWWCPSAPGAPSWDCWSTYPQWISTSGILLCWWLK